MFQRESRIFLVRLSDVRSERGERKARRGEARRGEEMR